MASDNNHADESRTATRFAIVGVQRTGTTWIRTTLDNHPAILALGEVFLYSHGRFPFRRRAGVDVTQSYRKFVEASGSRKVRHFVARSSLVREYLQELYSQPDFAAIGFKLMRTQCDQFPMVIDYLLQGHVQIIHVVRRNVLKTLISRETARQRQLFHANGNVPVTRVSLDIATLRRSLDRITVDNAYWKQMFQGPRYMELAYEDFVSDRAARLQAIYDFLGVTPDHGVSSSLVKINPENLSNVLANYSDVARALESTPYACCLQE